MLTEVTIGGVNVSSYLVNWTVERSITESVGTADINLTFNVYNAISLRTGLSITIKRGTTTAGDTTVFKGVVETVIKGESKIVTVRGKDRLYELIKKEVTYSFDSTNDSEAGKLSEIFKTLIDTYGGLNYGSDSIQDSGTVFTLKQFICNHSKVFERCSKLAKALGWQFYYSPSDDYVYFEELGATPYTTTLTVGSQIINVPEWTENSSQTINKLKIIGAFREIETTETFSGDDTTTAFTLTNEPTSVKIYVDSTLKIGGVESSTASYDYTVDVKNSTINFVTAPPSTSADNIEVRYSYKLPHPVSIQDYSSQQRYGIYEESLVMPDIESVDDATERARKIIDTYGTPFVSTIINVVGIYDINPGNKVKVIDNINNEDRWVVVKKVIQSYPHQFDKLEVGDEEVKIARWLVNMEDRIRKLEKKEYANQEILTQIVEPETVNTTFEHRYFEVTHRDLTGNDYGIWDSPEYGIWDVNKWASGDSDLGSYTNRTNPTSKVRVIQYDSKYKEQFYDTDFVDSTYTTATQDTTNREMRFTSAGEVFQTYCVYYDNSSISKVRVNTTHNPSGSITFEIDTTTYPAGRTINVRSDT